MELGPLTRGRSPCHIFNISGDFLWHGVAVAGMSPAPTD
jgi:hypothetical protein